MSFNYNHEKNKHQENFWTSYADLYTTLFTIFLFIYVGSTLKQGTKALEQHQDRQILKNQISDLQQQLKVYEALKDDYMKKEAQPEDAKLYDELMGKLDLLQDDAKNEKENLRKKAMENEIKEKALNKYQQLIRNMINSNVLAKTKIQKRNEIIDAKENIINERNQSITELSKNVEDQRSELAASELKIKQTNAELDNKVKKLEAAYKSHQMTKKEMDDKIKNLQAASSAQVAQLKNQADEIKNQLNQTNQALAGTQSQLEKSAKALEGTKSQLAQTNEALANANKEKGDLENELNDAKGKYDKELGNLKGQYGSELADAKKNLANALAKEKLTGAEKAKKEAALKQIIADKEKAYQNQLDNLKNKFDKSQGDLKDAIDKINTKKRLADQIRKNFKKNGIDVDVDEKTGEVVLDFKNSYFETGHADLKPEMISILQKFIPIYSEGLFEDSTTANKIASIEIIGFASPTFKGKLVDPSSLDQSNRSAVNYNLDLSYNRAKSIFSYIFDTNKMKYNNQQRLLGLVKVTGRSFLAKTGNNNTDSSADSFCSAHDCKKEQRVVIKFNLKD